MTQIKKEEHLDPSNSQNNKIDLVDKLEEVSLKDSEEASPMGDIFSGTVEDEFRDGFKTSDKENALIKQKANEAENRAKAITLNKQQFIYPENLEELIKNSNQQEKNNKKIYQDKPFIKNQVKVAHNSTRIKERLIKVFDLSKEEDLKKLNELTNQSIREDTSIENLVLREHFSEKDGTWKILATYDILEFTNPL